MLESLLMGMIVPPNASHPFQLHARLTTLAFLALSGLGGLVFFPLRSRLLFAAWNYRKFMEFGRLLKSPFEDDVRPSPSDRRTIYE